MKKWRNSSKVVIGVSGDEGSFSDQAARGWAAISFIENYEVRYLIEIGQVLAQLQNGGEIDLGVFPYKNNFVGEIDAAHDAMEQHNFRRIGKFPLLVEHCLLGRKRVHKSHITKIVSQKPAIDQCDRNLSLYWRHVEIEEYADTAKAARDLASGLLPQTTAVIASPRTAELYADDLEVIQHRFQSEGDNLTWFNIAERR